MNRKLIFLLLFLAGSAVFAQQNPFLSTGQTGNGEPASASEESAGDSGNTAETAYTRTGLFFNSALMQRIRKFQKSIQAVVSDYIGRYKSGAESGSLLTFLGFSYLYGLLHVLGPGHRKIFLFTYFVSKPSKWKMGMLAGILTAVLHALSAVVLVGGLYLITSRALLTRFNNLTPIIETVSYGMITAIGLYLLISNIIQAVKHGGHSHGTGKRSPDTLMFVLASGLVPCPGAATIMIFSLAVQAPLIGTYSVLAMSLGMATVLAFVPPAAILIQNRLDPVISKWSPETGEFIHSAVSIAGAAAVTFFGLLFLI